MNKRCCPECGRESTGHGWEDHACWCIRGWRILDRTLEKRNIKQRKEGKMPVIKEIGFYEEPNEVGYVAWIETIDGTYFIDVDGKITKPEM